MKILIMDAIKTLGNDGSTVHRWELARNLSKLGCEVYAISYTNINPDGIRILHPLPRNSKIKYIDNTTPKIGYEASLRYCIYQEYYERYYRTCNKKSVEIKTNTRGKWYFTG